MPKIYIAVCSGRDWKPAFCASLCGLIHYTRQPEVFLAVMQGSGIVTTRQLAISNALEGGYSHILFLDDDMQFPPTLLEGLLARALPIVTINYVRKEIGNNTPLVHDLAGVAISSKGKTGIEEAGWIGFGGVLIDLNAIREMPKPWFEIRWMDDRQAFMGEDFYFSMKARQHGAKIYVDHDLSNQSAHIGDYWFKEV